MKTADWVGRRVQAASDIKMEDGRVIAAHTVLRVESAKHCRLTLTGVENPMLAIRGVSMGAVKILPK